ncbi:MAG: Txe/YoeB family addiction module toxin [Giesbergeria sp.]|uniref:Txe/YoeB family addiction module toxin n=1 Tax=Giesbergeria sp. TaxID=2818473 RepID=UPI0026217457|nr:Txe/YoeB family addiction module toxin [Giesbergeria sp.]MDD2610125.1 Txe/YoeB family addiction module toxin [Giesbergeria sp.]
MSLNEQNLSRLTWTQVAWEDYEYWQGQDKKTLKRIHALIKDAVRHPFEGIGKPEPLKANLSGFWSRRIDDSHRLVYCAENAALVIVACRYHYQ